MLNFKTIQSTKSQEWLVFIHGAGGSLKTWKRQEAYFAKHFNLLILDLRDHGQSKNIEPAYASYTFEIISKDILQVINHLHIQEAHFMALSLGSVVIQDLATRNPEVVKSVVIAGGIFSATRSLKVFIEVALLFNRFLPYQLMYRLFSYLVMPRKRNQQARKIYQNQAKLLKPIEYTKWLGLYSEFFGLINGFYNHQIQFPMHVIMGQEDFIFIRGARRFAQVQSEVTISEIQRCGHICNIECHEEFNELALNFLKSNSSIKQTCEHPV